MILIPEIPWTYDNVCAKILQRRSMGKNFTLVVVAEGAELPSGETVAVEQGTERQQARLGGIGDVVTDEIKRRLHVEARCVVLGHLQRGGGPTAFDRVLATQYGAHAVRLIEEGRFGEMVCYDPPNVTSIRLPKRSIDCRRWILMEPPYKQPRHWGSPLGMRLAIPILFLNRRFGLKRRPKNSISTMEKEVGPFEFRWIFIRRFDWIDSGEISDSTGS